MLKVKDVPIEGIARVYSRNACKILEQFYDDVNNPDIAEMEVKNIYAYEDIVYIDVA